MTLRSGLERLGSAAALIAAPGVVCGLLAVLMQIGCSDPKHAGKCPVSGSVTWNGEPIESGFVTFQPADGKSDEAGPIKNGRFSFYAHPGKNRVSVRAEKVSGFNQGMNQPNLVPYIPAKYNTESMLSADVVPDGENTFEFPLTGDEAGS